MLTVALCNGYNETAQVDDTGSQKGWGRPPHEKRKDSGTTLKRKGLGFASVLTVSLSIKEKLLFCLRCMCAYLSVCLCTKYPRRLEEDIGITGGFVLLDVGAGSGTQVL